MNSTQPSAKRSSWRWVLPWLSVVAWAALIFYLSAQPSLKTDLGVWDLILRKGAHMVEFAVLCLLLWNAIRPSVRQQAASISIAAAISLLYAFSDEFHQRFVPGRSGALRDVGFDTAGIIIMCAIVIITKSKRGSHAGATTT